MEKATWSRKCEREEIKKKKERDQQTEKKCFARIGSYMAQAN